MSLGLWGVGASGLEVFPTPHPQGHCAKLGAQEATTWECPKSVKVLLFQYLSEEKMLTIHDSCP